MPGSLTDEQTGNEDERRTDVSGRGWAGVGGNARSPGEGDVGTGVAREERALLPEHAIHIVFTSGEESLSEEYTGMSALEDLSDGELREWFEAARRGEGL